MLELKSYNSVEETESLFASDIDKQKADGNMTAKPITERASKSVIVKELNQKEKVKRWLEQFGFEYDPFAATDTERDHRLTEYFVEFPEFEPLIGLNSRLVFARPGDGKTTMRLRLQALYRDAVIDHHVFAFSYLIPQEIAAHPPMTLDGHIESILSAAVRHAFIFYALRGFELEPLHDPRVAQQIAKQFVSFFDEYYGIIGTWRDDLLKAKEDYSFQQSLTNLDPIYDDLQPLDMIGSINTQWLSQWLTLLTNASATTVEQTVTPMEQWQQFAQLIKLTGVETIMILIDGVDIKPMKSNQGRFTGNIEHNVKDGVARMVEIILPLLEATTLDLATLPTYWKLFLPLELYLPLSNLLPNKVECDIVEWDRKRLKQLLRTRLRSASNGAVISLNQLVDKRVTIDLEMYLCAASQFSPRYLLHYVEKLFAAHIENSSKYEVPGKITGDLLSHIHYIPHPQS